MRALGFTGGQVRATVRWQASASAIVPLVVGVPLGMLVGRAAWVRLASGLYAVSPTTVPLSLVVAVMIGYVLFANVVGSACATLVSARSAPALLRGE